MSSVSPEAACAKSCVLCEPTTLRSHDTHLAHRGRSSVRRAAARELERAGQSSEDKALDTAVIHVMGSLLALPFVFSRAGRPAAAWPFILTSCVIHIA